jgi:hypothetical protein
MSELPSERERTRNLAILATLETAASRADVSSTGRQCSTARPPQPRTAFVHPNKIALVHGERRYTCAQLASGLGASRTPSVMPVSAQVTASDAAPELPGDAAGTFRRSGRRGVLVTVNTRLSSAPAPASCSSTPSWPGSSTRSTGATCA